MLFFSCWTWHFAICCIGNIKEMQSTEGYRGLFRPKISKLQPMGQIQPSAHIFFLSFYFRKTTLLRCNLHTKNFPFKMYNFTIYSIFTVYNHPLASPVFIRKILLGHSHSHPCLSVAVFTAVGELRGRALNRCVIWAADLRNLLPCLHKEGLRNPLFNALDRFQIYVSF